MGLLYQLQLDWQSNQVALYNKENWMSNVAKLVEPYQDNVNLLNWPKTEQLRNRKPLLKINQNKMNSFKVCI